MKKHIIHLIAILLSLLPVQWAMGLDKSNAIMQNKRTLSVLAIGNSYTLDALAYLPDVLESCYPDVSIKLGICTGPSYSLYTQMMLLQGGKSITNFHKYEDGEWVTESYKPYPDILDEQWDIISLQQVSVYCCNFNTIEPYLGQVVQTLRTQYHQSGKIAWLLPQGYSDGTPYTPTLDRLKGDSPDYMIYDTEGNRITTSDDMWAAQKDVAKMTQKLYWTDGEGVTSRCIDFVLTPGTALQDLRQATSLAEEGEGKGLFFSDLHVQQGGGALVQAWYMAMALFGVVQAQVIDTPNWPTGTGRGTVIAMDDVSQQLAYTAAVQALVNPFLLCTTDTGGGDGNATIRGDLNDDGVVDVHDVNSIINILLGEE